MDRVVIVFVKYPTPGEVKTRLARAVGENEATLFYKDCAEHTVRIACRFPTAFCIVACPPERGAMAQVRGWLQLVLQEPGIVTEQAHDRDLGHRMLHAMQTALQGGASKVVLIGSDCPSISEDVLAAAFAAVGHHDIVFGKALDGGFFLVGASRLHHEMFKGIQWSTESVLENSVKQAQACGLRVAPIDTLPTLQDIDVIEDLDGWAALNANSDHPLIHTACQVLAKAAHYKSGVGKGVSRELS